MPYATNARDGRRVYFEDNGGVGAPVVLHGGLLDSVADLRESAFAHALPGSGFRLVCVDHRGLGSSDKPHEPEGYAMPLRVADAVAVLDQLGIEQAHFIGQSWGGRVGFGIGEHAPQRVRSLVIGGNQPYPWPDSPLVRTVTDALSAARTEGTEALVGALEGFWESASPRLNGRAGSTTTPMRSRPPGAQQWPKVRSLRTLRSWRAPCLIFLGAADVDFLDGARRAAEEIPNAELLLLTEADHYAAHVSEDEAVFDAALRVLRAS